MKEIFRSLEEFQELNSNRYDLIYTDPPWQQTKGGLRGCRPNQQKALDYATMTMADIKEFHREIFKYCNIKHNVFMWTIDKYLHETEQMMKELGYELHARMIWDKTNGVAPAFTVRYSHEYLLWFYRKGNMLKPSEDTRGKYRTVFTEQATKHSKKPVCAYEMLEDMFPNAVKLEVFARITRNGWNGLGNELERQVADNGRG